MSRFGSRVVLLFALVATVPVALTALVWLAVTYWGAPEFSAEAEMARRELAVLQSQRALAIERLCRDDLATDRLLDDRSREAASGLDYDRLFRSSMEAAGFQVLWVLDALSGEVLASGHRHRVLGDDGAPLARQAREAEDRSFVVALGDQEHQRYLVSACTIARGRAQVTVVGGHRLSELRRMAPEQLVVADAPGAQDEVIAELADARGDTRGVLLWRPRMDRRGPPLLLWVACVAALSLGFALMFGGYLNRWLQSSADELAEAAARVGQGDFSTTVRDRPNAAFPATATAFNRMTRDLKDARERLRQTERVAAWQEIAKSLAHELKNPLSPIRLSIETLQKAHARSHEDFDVLFEDSTKTILQEVERLRGIVDEFSRFARLPAPRLEQADLRDVVSRAASLHAEGDANVTAALPETRVDAQVDADQITQVLHNLLQNARDAAEEAHPDGGAEVRVVLEAAPGTAYIHVHDNGPGIPEGRASAIFEPYHTSKKDGTGLGLAIAQRIITEHGGRIDVRSKPSDTRFTVVLPRA